MMNQTGTFTFFVFMGLMAVYGTTIRYLVRRLYVANYRDTRAELEASLPERAPRILRTQREIIRVWDVSLGQVAANIGVAVLFMVTIVSPLIAKEHPWITPLLLSYLGCYYMGELGAWNILGTVVYWRLRRR